LRLADFHLAEYGLEEVGVRRLPESF
jgi:hypothetical protein